uniref:Uncharacterized protein n=1 Tax=Panagrolaimus superbus TaxID=310955 RepID=A0A914YXH7_9BILA
MNYFALIIFICFYSTVSSLQCYNNSTESPEITCTDPYCFIILTITGRGNAASYAQLEGCGTVLYEDPLLKSLNLTCQDGIVQSVNTSLSNVPFKGFLYCCKTDLCNAKIPGIIIPTPISQTVTPFDNTNTPQFKSSSPTTITAVSSTVSSDGIIVVPSIQSLIFFVSILFIGFK